ncbi:MAG: hypothetical protein NTY19_26905, partial [Planctomycetota bacterium]|nr:hypothetical protein [Planctomycetota bacterium]
MVPRVLVRTCLISVVCFVAAVPNGGWSDDFREATLEPDARQSFQEHVLKGPPGRTGVFVRQ